jgi:hypothetical protein
MRSVRIQRGGSSSLQELAAVDLQIMVADLTSLPSVTLPLGLEAL